MTLSTTEHKMAFDWMQNHSSEPLETLGIIRVTGEDARDFLHSQLTQDIKTLPKNETKLAAYCSAKGRMYGIFQVFAVEDAVYLITTRSLIEPIVKRLRMFVLRAKVIFTDASADFIMIGQTGLSHINAAGQLTVVDHAIHLGLLPAQIEQTSVPRQLVVLPQNAQAPCATISQTDWNWFTVRAAQPSLAPETYEAFVPQMLNLERIGGVNFKKGCYPGQEIVARSHYLGKLKRRMHTAQLVFDAPQAAQNAALKIGMDVFSSNDNTQAVGQIVAFAHSPMQANVVDILFEINLGFLENAAVLCVPQVQAAWRAQSLPYSLTDDA
jgi:folate-binding protein YgfZ